MAYTITSVSGLYLEAEVAPQGQPAFEARYKTATGKIISPGSPDEYQNQNNKWGAELRVYFNSSALKAQFQADGLTVEDHNTGYKSGEFGHRVNNNDFWWHLVENLGATLGYN